MAKIKCCKFQTLYFHPRNIIIIISYESTFFPVVSVPFGIRGPRFGLFKSLAHRFSLFWFWKVLARERGRKVIDEQEEQKKNKEQNFVYELELCFWDTKSNGVGVSATDKRLKQQYIKRSSRSGSATPEKKCGRQKAAASPGMGQTSEQKSSPTTVTHIALSTVYTLQSTIQ